jgi:hypothetical protein
LSALWRLAVACVFLALVSQPLLERISQAIRA